jgi:hypothetical protein
MRRIAFTEAGILQLKKERIDHEHPIVRRRMMALYLKAMGYRHKEICCELSIQFYSDFQLFRAAITNCLKKTHTEYRDELDSLLRPNYQSFTNVPFNP